MEEYSESFQIIDTIVISLRTKTVIGKFLKISTERIQVRFYTGYVEVITDKLEPHLNHVPRNPLIINVFKTLHRQINVYLIRLKTDMDGPYIYIVHPYQ